MHERLIFENQRALMIALRSITYVKEELTAQIEATEAYLQWRYPKQQQDPEPDQAA